VSITNSAADLTFTASASLLAVAQLGSRGSDQKDSAQLAQTLDQLLKNNPQLLERNRHLMGEMCRLLITLRTVSLRNDSLNSTPVNQVQTLDHLTDINRWLQKKNQKLVGEVAATRDKLVGRSEARTKVEAEKATAKIAAWIASPVRKALR
jgi:hypothetical protein